MTALLLPGETLTLGLNVIVRPGDRLPYPRGTGNATATWVDPPQDWVALTGACPTCDGSTFVRDPNPPITLAAKLRCSDCRGGRKLTDFGNGVKAIVVSVEPEPDGRNWRITLEVPE